jgi:anti-anti-sigma factor
MEIKEERAGDVLVLAPDGNLSTSEECRALDERLSAALAAGARFLVVDFARVGHLTAASLRALLLTSRKLARLRGRIVLCNMTPKVQKAFTISGFDRDFTVLPTREAAVTVVLQPVAPPAKAAGRGALPATSSPPAPPTSPTASATPTPAALPTTAPEHTAPLISPPVDPVPTESVRALAARVLAALGAPASVPLPTAAPSSSAAGGHDALAASLVHALDAQPA